MIRQINKILISIFVFLVIFNIDAQKVCAVTDAALLFNQANVTANVGESITLTARINPGSNEVGAVELDVVFDPEVLRLESITKANSFNITVAGPTINNTSGTGSIDVGLLTDPATYITNTSDVATFVFTALAPVSNSFVFFAGTSNASAHGEYVVDTRTPAQVTIIPNEEGDVTAPLITNFIIPAVSSSLTISEIDFTATDEVGVTGYKLTETSTTPSASDSGWNITAPNSYTFSSAGVKTLYAWAKDAAGNVSTSLNDSVTITLVDADDTAPVITEFVIPSSASSLIVSITNFVATDNVEVTGYILTETSVTPLASDSNWSATSPANYTFSSVGTKTLYAWAKDAAGNVSDSLSDTIEITFLDILAPTITSFNIPSTSSSLNVPVSSFVAEDNVEVTGYILKEESSIPSVTDEDWRESAPSTYTFSLAGIKTLYAWVKDAAGNVSDSLNDEVEIIIKDIGGEDNEGNLVLSDGAPSGTLSSSATAVNLSLKTNKNATCRFSSDRNIAYDEMSINFTTTGEKHHSYKVEGIKEGREYEYYVKCKDSQGNINQNDYLIAFSIKDKDSKEEEKTKRKITNSKSNLKRGEILIQKGKRFSKKSDVLLYFSKADGSYYSPMKVRTDSEGKFEVTYKINKPQGKYTWYAVDLKTGRKSKIKDYIVK